MWLHLGTNKQYRFEDISDPVAFYTHLDLLVDPSDTLVLGCYDARDDIREFLASQALPPSDQRFHPQDTFDLNRVEYPNGAVFHLRADPATLQQLAQFAKSVGKPVELCDHIAAYSSEQPLFIFHGLFLDPLFVSSCVARTRVEAFSKALNAPFDEIDFDKTYSI